MLRCALAILLASGLVVAPATAFPTHAAFEAEAALAARHAELGVATASDSHVHDDGEPEERRIGHDHEGGTADHSHEKAGILGLTGTSLLVEPQAWPETPHPAAVKSARFDLERPPRRMF